MSEGQPGRERGKEREREQTIGVGKESEGGDGLYGVPYHTRQVLPTERLTREFCVNGPSVSLVSLFSSPSPSDHTELQ